MKKVYIKTVGCQMNVLDSEMVIADLKRHGYVVVDSPAEAPLAAARRQSGRANLIIFFPDSVIDHDRGVEMAGAVQ